MDNLGLQLMGTEVGTAVGVGTTVADGPVATRIHCWQLIIWQLMPLTRLPHVQFHPHHIY